MINIHLRQMGIALGKGHTQINISFLNNLREKIFIKDRELENGILSSFHSSLPELRAKSGWFEDKFRLQLKLKGVLRPSASSGDWNM